MKNIIISFLFSFITINAFTQPLRIHVMGGFANYTGDLQSSRFTLNQAKGVITAGATFNITRRFALRSDYSFAKVSADDKLTVKNAARNLNFSSLIKEFNLLGEFDILNMNERRFTPYVFAGVGVFKFSPYTTDGNSKKVHLHGLRTEGQETSALPEKKHYKRLQLNIPVGGGIKYAISDDVQLALEVGFRKLFTDYLDDVSTSYVDQAVLLNEVGPTAVQYAFRGDELPHNPRPYPAAGSFRGNDKNLDSYYFGQLRISFKMNWFDDMGNGGRRNQLGCPTRF